MSGELFDQLHGIVEDSIQDALNNLCDDDLEKEFGMEYDGKVYLESWSIDESPLVERVLREIDNKFRIVDKE